ncbi:MAG: UbiD family decarboxylase, partial [Defluviicoccus sp.]|nr:UbiD family decarboxylase [Defluviicoccus sp.]
MAETAREAVTAKAGGNLRAVLPYADLREWLSEAEKLGEVTVARGLGKDADIGQAAELVMHSDEADCVVFDDIPGHEPGYRVLVNFFGGRRKNMTLGFPTELSKIELSEAYYAAQLKDLTPIPYETVDDGPVTENVFEGDDVDLGKFPAPFWHPEDGGHYIGTGSYDVTVDPDTGWMNLGTYRVMVQ